VTYQEQSQCAYIPSYLYRLLGFAHRH